MTRSRTIRTRHGAAIVEALSVVPVLGLLLLGVPLVREVNAARQQALADARSCGFAYALSGCSELPVACQSPRRDAAPEPGPESDVVAIARSAAGDGFGVFDDLPLLGNALATLLGDSFESRAAIGLRQRVVERPPVQGAILLVCNEQPRDVLAIAHDMFCRHLPLPDCGGAP